MSLKIFSGSSHKKFAQSLADFCEIPLGNMETQKFSCGEIYVRFGDSLRGQDVFLVQTGRTSFMNEDLIELLLMIDAAKKSFAKTIHVILPYFPYCRQDKIHAPREGISAKLFAQIIGRSGADHVITLHLHTDQIQGFFDGPTDNLSSQKVFVEYLKTKNIKNSVVVSPDAGGAKNAKSFSDALGVPLTILHKQRPAHNVSEVTHVIGDIKGKIPIIVDDIVDTAGSVCAAKKALIEAGSDSEVYLCATHPVFSGPAVERLSEANFAEIICTDSLPVTRFPKNFKQISVAPLFAEVLKNVYANKSVSSLQ